MKNNMNYEGQAKNLEKSFLIIFVWDYDRISNSFERLLR